MNALIGEAEHRARYPVSTYCMRGDGSGTLRVGLGVASEVVSVRWGG